MTRWRSSLMPATSAVLTAQFVALVVAAIASVAGMVWWQALLVGAVPAAAMLVPVRRRRALDWIVTAVRYRRADRSPEPEITDSAASDGTVTGDGVERRDSLLRDRGVSPSRRRHTTGARRRRRRPSAPPGRTGGIVGPARHLARRCGRRRARSPRRPALAAGPRVRRTRGPPPRDRDTIRVARGPVRRRGAGPVGHPPRRWHRRRRARTVGRDPTNRAHPGAARHREPDTSGRRDPARPRNRDRRCHAAIRTPGMESRRPPQRNQHRILTRSTPVVRRCPHRRLGRADRGDDRHGPHPPGRSDRGTHRSIVSLHDGWGTGSSTDPRARADHGPGRGCTGVAPAGCVPHLDSLTEFADVDAADLRHVSLSPGGCGQLVGADADGRGVSVRAVGPDIERLDVIGEPYLAQQVLLRAVATGARIAVYSDRPQLWRQFVGSIGDTERLALGGTAGPSASTTAVVFDGVEPFPLPRGVTAVHVGDTPKSGTVSVALLQPGGYGGRIVLWAAGSRYDLTMVGTPAEAAFLGRPRSAPAPAPTPVHAPAM